LDDVAGNICQALVRGPMRAGNLGHVTRMGNKLVAVVAGAAEADGDENAAATTATVSAALAADSRWAVGPV